MAIRPGAIGQDWNASRLEERIDGLLVSRRVSQYLADPGVASCSSVGMIAPTTEGTLTTTGLAAFGATIFTSTASVSGVSEGFGGWITGQVVQRRWLPDLHWNWGTSNKANARFWVGVFSADPKAIVSPTGIQCIGLRYDDVTDNADTFIKLVTSNNSATPLVTSTGVAMDIGTITSRIRVRPWDLAVEVWINGRIVVVLPSTETTLPTDSSSLMVAAKVTALSTFSGTRVLRHGRMALAMT